MLERLVREPLLHFALAGVVLLSGYRLLHPELADRETSNRIVVTEDDLRQMSLTWLAQGRPPPSPEQMRSLVDTWVREEILFREALALGLDQGDTIVKRRMAQKMEFLTDDLSDLREPTRGELQVWFRENAQRFARPARATFRHLYFSPDTRGEQARVAAGQALEALAGRPADAPEAATLADPFMRAEYDPERTPEQVAKDFGPRFAEALLQLAPGSWQGPIESGFGWHLVFVDSVTPARVPDFEEVEPEIETAWVAEQRRVFKQKAFEVMKSRYVIEVPGDLGFSPVAVGSAPGHATE